ncbi:MULTISPECIES: hypothetical protein [unclassified Bradyrhizobium]|uniref:hypothetical protein n=1 Tax=unclassified Bradyrhizobium TaxID=2631580 RepID=UPI001FF902C9|nr:MULTISPECIES: hypothetical protein [unclassified Bradyrhizobium]MCK1403600.1 hypothetical protein [Bradyrhizobium sp. 39]MCK1746795.1 hypothetical protein [Bradyrhizobium sp. 135]
MVKKIPELDEEDAALFCQILALWDELTEKGRRALKPTLKLQKGVLPTDKGRSEDSYHVACRRAALAVLKKRRIYRDDTSGQSRPSIGAFTAGAINEEINKSDLLRQRAASDTEGKVYDAIARQVISDPVRRYPPGFFKSPDLDC